MIRVIVSDPVLGGGVREIEPDLATFQEIVGGYIEVVASGSGWIAYGDEEGRLKGYESNISASSFAVEIGGYPPDILVGPVVFVGYDGGPDEVSLSEEIINLWLSDGSPHE